MDIESKVKLNLLCRGFDERVLLNNRGLILAAIDETIVEFVKHFIASEPVKKVKKRKQNDT